MIPYDEPPENALPVPIIVQEKTACSQYTKNRCLFDTGERKIRLHTELLIQGRQIHQHDMRIFLSSDLDAGEISYTGSISRF
jgi:hypothetical protein